MNSAKSKQPGADDLRLETSKFTGTRIACALRLAGLRAMVAEVSHTIGVAEATFCREKQHYGGLGQSGLSKMLTVEDEKSKLEQFVVDLGLDNLLHCKRRRPRGSHFTRKRCQIRRGGHVTVETAPTRSSSGTSLLRGDGTWRRTGCPTASLNGCAATIYGARVMGPDSTRTPCSHPKISDRCDQQMTLRKALRRRLANPIMPKPATIRAQFAGSGTVEPVPPSDRMDTLSSAGP